MTHRIPTTSLFRRGAWRGVVLAAIAALSVGGGRAAEPPPADDQVAKLIQQLGDKDYALREQAQSRLAELGFEAFDALSAAETNPDLEIASRAAYLVRLMRVEWTRPGDAAEVKKLLQDYEVLDETARYARIEALVALPQDAGLAALCRLVRFEKSPILSKLAAIALLRLKPVEAAALANRQAALLKGLGASNRPAAEWLRVSVRAQQDPNAAYEAWAKLVEAERTVLERSPSQSRPQIVVGLLRRQVDLLQPLGREDEAIAVIRTMFNVGQLDLANLVELGSWLAERKAWSAVDELASRFGDRFEADPLRLYELAYLCQQKGNAELAEKIAEQARLLGGPQRTFVQHAQIAFQLQKRGWLKWAEAKYRQALELSEPTHPTALAARSLLSEMLHDRGDELEAAKVLKVAVDAIDEKAKKGIQVPQLGSREPATLRARMNFFFAAHYASLGDRPNQIKYLDEAMRHDPTDADVLIALYHLPGLDAARRDKNREQIKAAVADFRQQIARNPEEPALYNQLAWLVANTEGDQNEALAASEKSLELMPDSPGYLDTLARCYYAKGDLDNAVKYQTRALELEPHSGQMQKQLELFRKAQAEKAAAEKNKK
jgi:tetratricopeptide (TPR) repeat protein